MSISKTAQPLFVIRELLNPETTHFDYKLSWAAASNLILRWGTIRRIWQARPNRQTVIASLKKTACDKLPEANYMTPGKSVKPRKPRTIFQKGPKITLKLSKIKKISVQRKDPKKLFESFVLQTLSFYLL